MLMHKLGMRRKEMKRDEGIKLSDYEKVSTEDLALNRAKENLIEAAMAGCVAEMASVINNQMVKMYGLDMLYSLYGKGTDSVLYQNIEDIVDVMIYDYVEGCYDD
jgi:hypothetical protein